MKFCFGFTTNLKITNLALKHILTNYLSTEVVIYKWSPTLELGNCRTKVLMSCTVVSDDSIGYVVNASMCIIFSTLTKGE